MAEESKQRVHILRLFGMEQAALVRILREAAAQGCPGLRLLEQGASRQCACGPAAKARRTWTWPPSGRMNWKSC